MITWGISANSHDAALAVFRDEQLVFASHSERFSGKKNDRDLSHALIDYAKMKHGGSPDHVVWYENPYLKIMRQLFAGQGWKWSDNNIKKYLKSYFIKAPITYVNHHKSHAAAGYFTSPFDQACVVVLDAIGEFTTYSVWQADGNKLNRLTALDYPNSLGLWYSAMTQRCHLKPNEEEYILMGMAAYGNPNKLSRSLLDDFVDFPNDNYQHAFRIKKNLHRGCQDWRSDLVFNDVFDIAAATQTVYEMAFERVLQQATELSGSRNLVLMGGCALNCLANRLTGKYFDNTWIMPNPGDAGSAIGAVLAVHPEWRIDSNQFSPLLGYDMGNTNANRDIVEYLLDKKICGVARGRAEFGPRALGNRSLLADPRGADIKDTVNAIKQRQEFRPFAPAILEEHVDMYFDMPAGWSTSRYMQVIARCRHPQLYPAIVHRDGTSRVQTVPKDASPFRQLLELWYAQTGCPMLLNTSLNIKGKPMVNDHADARNFERQYGVKVFN
jgi:carbamoyltransferase